MDQQLVVTAFDFQSGFFKPWFLFLCFMFKNANLTRCSIAQIKDEAWWLILGNTSTAELYALKRVSFSDRLVTHMELPSDVTLIQVLGFRTFESPLK